MGMEIVTGSTGAAHVTPVDDAVRNGNSGYLNGNAVFDVYDKFAATIRTSNIVRIGSGYGMMQGRLFKISELDYEDLIIDNGSQGVKRCDLICARYSMNQQTGVEKFELVVLQGEKGQNYVKPQTLSGDINSETKIQADFPLYEVHINGITLESCTALFTPLPDGGRIGLIEKDLKEHKETSDPHRITFVDTGAGDVENIVSRESFANIFKKIATAIKALTAHIDNKSNPHNVKGSQLADAVPISKGGTGATTKAGALANLGIPSNVADSMAKSVYDCRIEDAPINYITGVNIFANMNNLNVEGDSEKGTCKVTSKELKGGTNILTSAYIVPEGQYKAIVQVAHSNSGEWTHQTIGSGIFYWAVVEAYGEIDYNSIINDAHDITKNPVFTAPKDAEVYIVYKNDNNGSISFNVGDEIRTMIVKATTNTDNIDLFDDNIYNYHARPILLRADLLQLKKDLSASFQNGVDTIKNAITAKNVTPTASTPSALATAVGEVYTKGQTDAQAVTWTKDVTIRAYNSSVAEAEYDITNVTKIKCISGDAFFSANITTVSGRQQIAGGYHLAVGDECDMTRANKDIPTTSNNTVEVATNSSAKIRFTYVARKRL